MTNLFKQIFLTVLLSNYSVIVFGLMDIIVQDLKCSNINPEYAVLKRCQVKPGPNQKGVIYGIGYIKKPIEPWLDLHFYWNGSTTGYQPYEVDFELEICELSQIMNIQHPFMHVILDIAGKIVNPELITALKDGCPIMAPVNITGLEVDRDLKPYLPPFIPEGKLKLGFHFHDGFNCTYGDIDLEVDIRIVRLPNFMKLGREFRYVE